MHDFCSSVLWVVFSCVCVCAVEQFEVHSPAKRALRLFISCWRPCDQLYVRNEVRANSLNEGRTLPKTGGPNCPSLADTGRNLAEMVPKSAEFGPSMPTL